MTTTTYIVGVYEISREWPTLEEDGKWYKVGKLVRASRIFRNEQSAYDYAYRMQKNINAPDHRSMTDRRRENIGWDDEHLR